MILKSERLNCVVESLNLKYIYNMYIYLHVSLAHTII